MILELMLQGDIFRLSQWADSIIKRISKITTGGVSRWPLEALRQRRKIVQVRVRRCSQRWSRNTSVQVLHDAGNRMILSALSDF